MQNNANESLFKHIILSKGFKASIATFFAIVLGLIFGFIVMVIASPSNAIYGLTQMLFGGFTRIGDVFYYATPLLLTGLSVGFAFKMGLFNIGSSGQYTMGMFFALYAGFMWDFLPAGIHLIVCILAGILGGMLWGFIPGLLKAHMNVNEVITAIMTNYIGMYLVDMLVQGNRVMYDSTRTRTNYLPITAQLKRLSPTSVIIFFAVALLLWLFIAILKKHLKDPKTILGGIIILASAGLLVAISTGDSNVNIGFLIAIAVAFMLYVVLYKTTFGYELIATGLNKHAGQYAGIKFKRNTILTMVIAGGLSGLGGALAYLAPSGIVGSSMTYEPINVIATAGFNGIAVALLGSSNPLGIIFSALFVSLLQRGGSLTSLLGYKPEIIDVVIAIIIYFSAFSLVMSTAFTKFIGKTLDKKRSKHIEDDLHSDVKEA